MRAEPLISQLALKSTQAGARDTPVRALQGPDDLGDPGPGTPRQPPGDVVLRREDLKSRIVALIDDSRDDSRKALFYSDPEVSALSLIHI